MEKKKNTKLRYNNTETLENNCFLRLHKENDFHNLFAIHLTADTPVWLEKLHVENSNTLDLQKQITISF